MIRHSEVTEAVRNLEIRIVHAVLASGNVVLVADVAGIELASSFRVALRRDGCLLVEHRTHRMHAAQRGCYGTLYVLQHTNKLFVSFEVCRGISPSLD